MKRKQGFLFDYNFCIGCKACEISCQVYHNQDPDINWRHVDMMLIHEDEIEKEIFISHSCHHCEEPACVAGCPCDVLKLVDAGVSDSAGMEKEMPGFKRFFTKPNIRFYPRMKRNEFIR